MKYNNYSYIIIIITRLLSGLSFLSLSRFCTVVLFGSLLAASNMHAGEYEQRSDVQAFADL